jgi:uncharacterized integral membrane protein
VSRQFLAGFATTIAFVVIIALLLMAIFIVVNTIAGPVGG